MNLLLVREDGRLMAGMIVFVFMDISSNSSRPNVNSQHDLVSESQIRRVFWAVTQKVKYGLDCM